MIAHLHAIYTCTYGILFFGTPHNGSSQARLFSNLQRMVSLTMPKKVLQTDSNLLKALQEDSETLRDITDQFAPIMHRFRVYYFWEQERTDLKYTMDYVVDEPSAAPILDNTERSGIRADHRNMCRFDGKDSPGFRTVMAALKRYCQEAPGVVSVRLRKASFEIGTQRRSEAEELFRAFSETSAASNQARRTLPFCTREPNTGPHSLEDLQGSLEQATVEADSIRDCVYG